jgi:hypothetical protein
MSLRFILLSIHLRLGLLAFPPISYMHISSPLFVLHALPITFLLFFSMALTAHSGPSPLIQFRNHFSQKVGHLGRGISPSQGRYLNTGQHKHRRNAYTHQTSMPWLGFETTIRASENSSCLRPRGYCDRPDSASQKTWYLRMQSRLLSWLTSYNEL